MNWINYIGCNDDMIKNIIEFIDSYKEISTSIDNLSDDLLSEFSNI